MLPQPLTAVIVISGRGSNMEQLILDQQRYRIIGVASNRSSAEGLQIAKKHNIPCFVGETKGELWNWIANQEPTLVLLAGYMQIVSSDNVTRFEKRVLNIHPALLPALPGLNTHSRALANGHKRHGATVHLVDAGIDTGDIIAQAALDVKDAETEEGLAARVLALEHQLYPRVVTMIADGQITLSPHVSFTSTARKDAQQRGFITP